MLIELIDTSALSFGSTPFLRCNVIAIEDLMRQQK